MGRDLGRTAHRSRRSGLTVLAVVAGTFAGGSPAAAQAPCSSDTTGATLDQYCETVPTARGRQGAADEPGASKMPSSGQPIPGRTAERLGKSSLGRIVVGAGPARAPGTSQDPAPAGGTQANDVTTPNGASPGRSGRGDTGGSIRGFQADDALAGLPLGGVAVVLVLLGGAAVAGAERARRGRSA